MINGSSFTCVAKRTFSYSWASDSLFRDRAYSGDERTNLTQRVQLVRCIRVLTFRPRALSFNTYVQRLSPSVLRLKRLWLRFFRYNKPGHCRAVDIKITESNNTQHGIIPGSYVIAFLPEVGHGYPLRVVTRNTLIPNQSFRNSKAAGSMLCHSYPRQPPAVFCADRTSNTARTKRDAEVGSPGMPRSPYPTSAGVPATSSAEVVGTFSGVRFA
jgi:hypothetical protein